MPAQTYDVYLGIYSGSPAHHAIWVDTGAKKTLRNGQVLAAGVIIQVKGSTMQGMVIEVKEGVDPEVSAEGEEKRKVGTIRASDLERVKQICSGVPPPAKQFEGFKKIDRSKPLYHCQHWTRDALHVFLTKTSFSQRLDRRPIVDQSTTPTSTTITVTIRKGQDGM